MAKYDEQQKEKFLNSWVGVGAVNISHSCGPLCDPGRFEVMLNVIKL
jgi:hypothetical protein